MLSGKSKAELEERHPRDNQGPASTPAAEKPTALHRRASTHGQCPDFLLLYTVIKARQFNAMEQSHNNFIPENVLNILKLMLPRLQNAPTEEAGFEDVNQLQNLPINSRIQRRASFMR